MFQIGTIFEDEEFKEDKKESDSEKEEENDIEELKEKDIRDVEKDADYFIIMERADRSLHDEIYMRKFKKKIFDDKELFSFWHQIVNVFAFCSF